jgi:RNA polymerase sigma-70 factor (sigma-E family)
VKPDDDEYEGFVVTRYRTLVRAAVLLGCSRHDAEDAAQDTLIRCFCSWSRVSNADDPDAYVFRILLNGISRGRRRKWHGETAYGRLPEPDPADDLAGEVSLSQTVQTALSRLRREQREVVVLRYFADFSEARIAQVLGIAQGTVKSRASRAIAALGEDVSLRALLPNPDQEDG